MERKQGFPPSPSLCCMSMGIKSGCRASDPTLGAFMDLARLIGSLQKYLRWPWFVQTRPSQ